MNDEERQKELLRIQKRLDARKARQERLVARKKAIDKAIDSNAPLVGPVIIVLVIIASFGALCWWMSDKVDVGKAVTKAKKAIKSSESAGVSWAGKDIVSIEEIKTDPSLNPVVGFRSDGKGGRKPVVGAMPKSGKTQWKVTWRDSNGVLRIQVTDQYPSR